MDIDRKANKLALSDDERTFLNLSPEQSELPCTQASYLLDRTLQRLGDMHNVDPSGTPQGARLAEQQARQARGRAVLSALSSQLEEFILD